MIADTQPGQLLAPIRPVLNRLRWSIRLYAVTRGLFVLAMWVAGAFWISYTTDRLLEPQTATRGVFAAVIAATLGWAWFRWVLSPAVAPLADSRLALLLERRFPHFGQRLLTAVELHDRWEEMGLWTRRMFAQTCQLAAEPIRQVRLSRMFRWKPLLAGGLVAGVLVGLTTGFVLAHPNDAVLWFRRCVLLQPVRWPRQSRLVVVGCRTGPLRVARGNDAKLVVRADLRMPLVPDVVRIRWRSTSGKTQQVVMTREGNADPAREVYQLFTYTFRNVLAPIELDVRGGDAVLRGLRIEPVDHPAITRLVLDCRFPQYTRRGRRQVAVVGPVRLPVGTRVTLHGTVNKPLVWLAIGSRQERSVQIHPAVASAEELLAEQVQLYEQATGNRTLGRWIAGQLELARRATELAREISKLDSNASPGRLTNADLPAVSDEAVETIQRAAHLMRQAAALGDRSEQALARSGAGNTAGEAPVAGDVPIEASPPQGAGASTSADWVARMEGAIEQLRRAVEQIGNRCSFREFSHELGTLGEDRLLAIELRDVEGISGVRPVEVALSAQPDQPPEVSVHLEGIGSAVTPAARIPVAGLVSDDLGPVRVWLEYAVPD